MNKEQYKVNELEPITGSCGLVIITQVELSKFIYGFKFH